MNKKLGRNDPCHCGSGKKYKSCCFAKDNTPAHLRKIKATWIKPTAAIENAPFQQDVDLMERTFGAHKSLMEKEAPKHSEGDNPEK
jgi:uncharacterized protein